MFHFAHLTICIVVDSATPRSLLLVTAVHLVTWKCYFNFVYHAACGLRCVNRLISSPSSVLHPSVLSLLFPTQSAFGKKGEERPRWCGCITQMLVIYARGLVQLFSFDGGALCVDSLRAHSSCCLSYLKFQTASLADNLQVRAGAPPGRYLSFCPPRQISQPHPVPGASSSSSFTPFFFVSFPANVLTVTLQIKTTRVPMTCTRARVQCSLAAIYAALYMLWVRFAATRLCCVILWCRADITPSA